MSPTVDSIAPCVWRLQQEPALLLRCACYTFPFATASPNNADIVLDENLEVTYKSVRPCCGYESYYDCTDEVGGGWPRPDTDG